MEKLKETPEDPKLIETFEEMTAAAVEMSKDLHQYVGQRSRYDLVLAVRSMAYTIGWLIADLPIELRERCFEAVLKDAMDTENTIRIAGLDGRAVEIDKKKNSIETPKRRNEKLW